MNEPIDIMDVDLSGVDTDKPILPPGIYTVVIEKLETRQNSSNTGELLNIEMHLEQGGVKSTKGREINPGFPIYDTVSLVKTDRYDPRERLAQFQEAVLGHKEAFGPFDKYVGKKCSVQVKVETSEEFGTRNRPGRYIKLS